jgi:hypothetical protein
MENHGQLNIYIYIYIYIYIKTQSPCRSFLISSLHFVLCKNIFRNMFSVFSHVWCYKNILVNGETRSIEYTHTHIHIATKMAKDDLCFVT